MRRSNLVFVITLVPLPALAWSGTVTWPTFYRVAPTRQSVVLDELERGRMMEVLACEGGWCRVQDGRSIGFVEQGALAPVQTEVPQPPGTKDCFDSRASGYGKGEVFRYCEKPSP